VTICANVASTWLCMIWQVCRRNGEVTVADPDTRIMSRKGTIYAESASIPHVTRPGVQNVKALAAPCTRPEQDIINDQHSAEPVVQYTFHTWIQYAESLVDHADERSSVDGRTQ